MHRLPLLHNILKPHKQRTFGANVGGDQGGRMGGQGSAGASSCVLIDGSVLYLKFEGKQTPIRAGSAAHAFGERRICKDARTGDATAGACVDSRAFWRRQRRFTAHRCLRRSSWAVTARVETASNHYIAVRFIEVRDSVCVRSGSQHARLFAHVSVVVRAVTDCANRRSGKPIIYGALMRLPPRTNFYYPRVRCMLVLYSQYAALWHSATSFHPLHGVAAARACARRQSTRFIASCDHHRIVPYDVTRSAPRRSPIDEVCTRESGEKDMLCFSNSLISHFCRCRAGV
eukprot:IDg4199t1